MSGSVSLVNGHIDPVENEMTPQEAIEWLKSIEKKYIHGGDEDFDKKRKTAINTAIQVLEKQIPKKVIEQTEEDREFIDFICPFCKTTLQQKIKTCFSQRYFKNTIYKYRFCLHCGQALDWSDT